MKRTRPPLLLKLLFSLCCYLCTQSLNGQIKTKMFGDSIPQNFRLNKAGVGKIIHIDSPAGFQQLRNSKTTETGIDGKRTNRFAVSVPADIDFAKTAERSDKGSLTTLH